MQVHGTYVHRGSLGAPRRSPRPATGTSRRLFTTPRVAAPERRMDAGFMLKEVGPAQHREQPLDVEIPEQPQDPAYEPITAMWVRLAAEHGQRVAMEDPHRLPGVQVTYGQLQGQILDCAAGLKALGLEAGDRVALFAENSCRWIVADQGMMMCGAADAVRGSTSPAEELAFILGASGSAALIVQDAATLAALLPTLQQPGARPLKFVAVLWAEEGAAQLQAARGALSCPVLTHEEVLERGRALRAVGPFQPHASRRGDLATLVYTSGTTGHPKGVRLSHGNLAFQARHLRQFLSVAPGDTVLALLPPWHIYQRSAQNYCFSGATRIVYTSVRKFRDDLPSVAPDHLVCVPLVLDTLHSKVMAKLSAEAGVKGAIVAALLAASAAFVRAQRIAQGRELQYALQPAPALVVAWAAVTAALLRPLHALAGRLVYSKVRAALGVRKTIVSGGGSLASHLDLFFEQIGLAVINGFGLTETSPVVACRNPADNVRGTVGRPIAHTEVAIVHTETHAPLPDGQQGLLLVRGPGVMQGYDGDAASTRGAFIDGWLNTGDLAYRVPGGVPGGGAMAGCLVLSGRAKDTIVLLSGKNIEPQPIEDACQCSPLIKHIMLVGQDKRELGALVFPDWEALEARQQQQQQQQGQQGVAAAGAAASTSGRPEAGPQQAAGSGGGEVTAELEAVLAAEVARLNAARPEFHSEDRITHIKVMAQPLSAEDGTLTRTLKPRRGAIVALYEQQVAGLLAQLRG